jgi:Domain of unknown function (DUF4440)
VTLSAAASADLAHLLQLNEGYLKAVEHSLLGWFEEHLADDFLCSTHDGSLLDKPSFLRRYSAPSTLTSLEAHDVLVRLLDDVALVHARTTFLNEGHPGRGRYTDVWARRHGRWLAISAHVTRC